MDIKKIAKYECAAFGGLLHYFQTQQDSMSSTSYICRALQSMQTNPNSLPPYDEEAVNQTTELIDIMAKASEEEEDPSSQKEGEINIRKYLLRDVYVPKLINGLGIYTRSRLMRIIDIKSNTLGQLDQKVRQNLAPHEMEFLNSYTQAVAKYSRAAGFDPTKALRPPQGLNAECIVLKDAGTILAGDSYINLRQNEVLTLRTNIAQDLEQQGFVQISEYLK